MATSKLSVWVKVNRKMVGELYTSNAFALSLVIDHKAPPHARDVLQIILPEQNVMACHLNFAKSHLTSNKIF